MRPIMLLLLFSVVGCSSTSTPTAAPKAKKTIEFSDAVDWSAALSPALHEITFRDTSGKPVDLKQYQSKQNVVLVITRGYQKNNYYGPGHVCLYCATQTSRFIANYPQFQEKNTEVIVVFPVEQTSQADSAQELYTKGEAPVEKSPFPLWIDAELLAVKHFGIQADLSKPAVYLLDKAGSVRYAYVGKSQTDRPSIKAVLAKIDEINAEKT
jgi:peroxiredoxin